VCYASPQYFNAMGISLMRGRPFSEYDTKGTPSVVVISEAMAHRYWGSQDPVGLQFDTWGGKHTIVGVVGDVRQDALAEDAKPQMYFALLQQKDWEMGYLVVRTLADPYGMIKLIKREVQAIDPLQPISKIRVMETVLAQSVSDRQLVMIAMGTFASIALILALIGVYGVLSYSTSQRTAEIGIRMALGARQGEVLRMILGHGLRLVLVGIGLGIAIASAVTRVLSSQLYAVTPTDPWTFAGGALLLVALALLACYLPARRASCVSPMIALKYQ
jgi:putative ABC transport system permease protein